MQPPAIGILPCTNTLTHRGSFMSAQNTTSANILVTSRLRRPCSSASISMPCACRIPGTFLKLRFGHTHTLYRAAQAASRDRFSNPLMVTLLLHSFKSRNTTGIASEVQEHDGNSKRTTYRTDQGVYEDEHVVDPDAERQERHHSNLAHATPSPSDARTRTKGTSEEWTRQTRRKGRREASY